MFPVPEWKARSIKIGEIKADGPALDEDGDVIMGEACI